MDVTGFVGLGTMGGPIATNLLRSGRRVIAFDIDDSALQRLVSRGAEAAASAAEVASSAPSVLLSLPGPKIVADVLASIEPTVAAGTLTIDLSTCMPSLAVEWAGRLAARGALFVDAPVTGAVSGAQAATLKVMVGGQGELFDRVRSVLAPIGNEFLSCGGAGTGYALKLIRNSFTVARMTALLEELELAEACGLDPQLLIDVQRMRGHLPMPQPRERHPDLSTTYRAGLPMSGTEWALAEELAHEKAVSWRIGSSVRSFWTQRMADQPGDATRSMERMHRLLEGWVDDRPTAVRPRS
jgi:3-hydroxyisobutyrate dehydrogenase